MNVILDTHLLIWFLEDSPELPISYKRWIETSGHDFWVSLVTPWELAIKSGLGKIQTKLVEQTIFEHQMTQNGFTIVPIRLEHVLKVRTLPSHHRDPFDRLLVAQAILEKASLLTLDGQLKPYGVVYQP